MSLCWNRTLGESPQWTRAFANSFKIATATTLIATPLGTPAAIGLATMRSRAKPIIVALISAPLVVPVVVVAVAFYRSEEHTSELQSLMRSSYAVISCNKKTDNQT